MPPSPWNAPSRRGEPGGAAFDSLLEDGELIGFGVRRIGVVDVDPMRLMGVPRGLSTGGEIAGAAGDGHHLQPAASGKHAWLIGNESVQSRAWPPVRYVPGVLGLVDDTRLGVDRHRLMDEAAHVAERHRIHGTGCVDRDFEDVSVRSLVSALGSVRGLFAGKPAPPWRGTTGAVHDGACQRNELIDEFNAQIAFCARDSDLERGGPAGAPRIVGGLGGCPALVRVVDHLVVADQADVAVGEREGGHPVEGVRHGQPVPHGGRPAARTDAHASEALRDFELGAVDARPQFTIRLDDRAAACLAPHVRQRRMVSRPEPARPVMCDQPGKRRRQHSASTGRSQSPYESAAVHRHRFVSSRSLIRRCSAGLRPGFDPVRVKIRPRTCKDNTPYVAYSWLSKPHIWRIRGALVNGRIAHPRPGSSPRPIASLITRYPDEILKLKCRFY